MDFTRYALYYAPPPSAGWSRIATGWLGWDMQTGQEVAHPVLADLPLPLAEITRAPRKYGLHATLKPPFRQAAGMEPGDLEAACESLVKTLPALSVGPLRLTRLGQFLALCPPATAELSDLAAACVRGLDHLRAPMTQTEYSRRLNTNLTPRQLSNLNIWGYPFVLDDFRFHITLSGRLPKGDLGLVQTVLEQTLVPNLPEMFKITDLALAGQDRDGRFHLLRRFSMSG